MEPYGRIQQPTEQELEDFMAQQYQSEPEGERYDPSNPDHVTTELMKPFPDAAIFADDKGMKYVKYHQVIRRLMQATGNRFDIDILDHRITPHGQTQKGVDKFLCIAQVKLTIPVLKSARTHIGVQVAMANTEDLMKGGVSDAIKKCAQAFGVGIDLAGDDRESMIHLNSPQHAQSAPQQAQRPPQAPAPIRPQNGAQQAQGAQGAQQGGSRPATDNQKRALWAISGANKQQIDMWAADYDESNDTITFATASALIEEHGGNRR